HLATGFQNLLYDHPAFPTDLRAEMEAWCHTNTADERKDGESDVVFLYKTRKKALGPFKRQLWELAEKDEIMATQEAKFRFLFEQLGIAGSRAMVERHITVTPRSRDLSATLRESLRLPGGSARDP
nr:aldolase [Chloroflexota bacterium]